MDKGKTFWIVIGAICIWMTAVTGYGVEHLSQSFHPGTKEVKKMTKAILEELKGIRYDIQALREALIEADIKIPPATK